MVKPFKWIVEFSVDPIWVADGFDPDNEQFTNILGLALSLAHDHEIAAQVLERPKDRHIAKAQGYKSLARYRKENWKGNKRIV